MKTRPKTLRHSIALALAIALLPASCSLFPVPDDARSGLAVVSSLFASGSSSGSSSTNSSTACRDYSKLYTDSGASLPSLSNGAGKFGDVDGDGDQDLALLGNNGAQFSDIYKNDGSGNFTAASAGLTGVDSGNIDFGDVDGDGDEDLVIQGDDGAAARTTLYLNDGSGNFTDAGAGFTAGQSGGLALEDIDNDGDLDLIQLAWTGAVTDTIIYSNNGSGSFTDTGSGATDIGFGFLTTGDVNGDGAIDFVGGGFVTPGFPQQSLVFTNNGSGGYTDAASGLATDTINAGDLGDLDGDGDLDLVAIGEFGGETGATYLNDGSGNFTADGRLTVDPLQSAAAVIGDIDGDGDQDLVLGGDNGIGPRLTRLLINTGDGTFIRADSGLLGIDDGDLRLADLDGDGDLDLLVVNSTGTNLYTNKSETSPVYDGYDCSAFDPQTLFTQVSTGMPDVNHGGFATADVDGDGDKDLLLTGDSGSSTTRLYRNDGGLGFTDTGAALANLRSSAAAFADVDGDGDQDLVIAGTTPRSTILYTNDGAGNFTDAGAGLTGVQNAIVTFADVNNDGDQDLLVSGYNGTNRITTLYTNNGSGGFTDSGAVLVGVSSGDHAFADVDGDGDLDLVITGYKDGPGRTSTLYTNDGAGNFTDAGAGLTDLWHSTASFADADGDGDLDLFMTGDDGPSKVSVLYTNDGSGNFSDSGASFIGIYVAFGSGFVDIDNDGDQDLLLVGTTGSEFRSLFYINDGSGNFTRLDVGIGGLADGYLHFDDMDGDGDQDVMSLGHQTGGVEQTVLYRNDL